MGHPQGMDDSQLTSFESRLSLCEQSELDHLMGAGGGDRDGGGHMDQFAVQEGQGRPPSDGHKRRRRRLKFLSSVQSIVHNWKGTTPLFKGHASATHAQPQTVNPGSAPRGHPMGLPQRSPDHLGDPPPSSQAAVSPGSCLAGATAAGVGRGMGEGGAPGAGAADSDIPASAAAAARAAKGHQQPTTRSSDLEVWPGGIVQVVASGGSSVVLGEPNDRAQGCGCHHKWQTGGRGGGRRQACIQQLAGCRLVAS